jgi:hypothetical protein
LTAPDADKPKRAAAPVSPLRLSGSWLAAQGRLPLAFMGLALAWLAAATGMVVASPEVLAMPHFAPAVVALTHAWVLGFFVTVAAGAIYQIAPVALGTTLTNERHGWWHFGLHAVGVPGMVYSFWIWDMKLLGHFGTFVGLGIVLFAVNTWRTVRRSQHRGPVAWSIGLAAGWLLLTVLAGLTLAANRFWHFIPLDPIALLRAHAHAGLIGFFVTLLQGVTFQLVPMFTLGEVRDWRLVKMGLWLSQTGLIGLTAALAWHAGYVAAAFAMLILAGMLASGWALKQALATRKKRGFDPGVLAFLCGASALVGTAVLGVFMVWPTTASSSAPGGLSAMVYAVLIVFGAMLPCIAGMMCKIVPFLTWMRAYGPKVGRVATPSAGALTKPRLERGAFALQGVAVGPLAAGAWLLNTTLLQIGACILAAGVAVFLIAMLGVLKHLWLPVVGAAATPKKPPQP